MVGLTGSNFTNLYSSVKACIRIIREFPTAFHNNIPRISTPLEARHYGALGGGTRRKGLRKYSLGDLHTSGAFNGSESGAYVVVVPIPTGSGPHGSAGNIPRPLGVFSGLAEWSSPNPLHKTAAHRAAPRRSPMQAPSRGPNCPAWPSLPGDRRRLSHARPARSCSPRLGSTARRQSPPVNGKPRLNGQR